MSTTCCPNNKEAAGARKSLIKQKKRASTFCCANDKTYPYIKLARRGFRILDAAVTAVEALAERELM